MKKRKDAERYFRDDVKARAVARYRAGGETMSAIAKSVGTSQQSIRNWLDAADKRDKAAKREAGTERTQSAPAEPPAKANGHAAKPAQKSLLELTRDLQAHMEAIKQIKGQLRKLLE